MSAWIRDTTERAVATYLEVFLGLLIAGWSTDKLNIGFFSTAALAAIPALLAVFKAALARHVDNAVSPASVVRD